MAQIEIPAEGRPTKVIGSEKLVGMDGNGFAIIALASGMLRRAGASAEFIKSYQAEATSGDYDHLLQASILYLDAE